jgi:hypothetical protein
LVFEINLPDSDILDIYESYKNSDDDIKNAKAAEYKTTWENIE